MKAVAIECGACKAHLSVMLPNASVRTRCPDCESEIALEVFPALFRPVARGRAGEATLVSDESSCFYHPKKKAVVACEGCGRFLCDLCDIEMTGRRLCAACIEIGAAKGNLAQVPKKAFYYDEIALGLAVLSLLICYVGIVAAPVSLYIAFRYWRTPLSVTPRGRWRFVLAIALDVVAILAWLSTIAFLIAGWATGGSV